MYLYPQVYSLATYKPIATCSGFKGLAHGNHINVPFCRAEFSADGRLVMAGIPSSQSQGIGGSTSSAGSHTSAWELRAWDTQTGHHVSCQLSGTIDDFVLGLLACLFVC